VCDRNVLVLGDFNYPGIDWISSTTFPSASPGAVDFLNTVENCFFTQHVLSPTRYNTVLDLVLTRDPDLVSDMKILHPLSTSDHNMLLFTVHIDYEVSQVKSEFRDYVKGNFDQIRSSLADVDWDISMSGTVNESWQRLRDLLIKLIEKHVPLKMAPVKHAVKKPLWMTYRAV